MESSVNTELLRSRVDVFVLGALLNGDGYAYNILEYIKEKTNSHYVMKKSSIYSVMKRLEKQGYIKSYLGDESKGGQRTYYALTDKGREFVIEEQNEWAYTRTLLDNLVTNKGFDLKEDTPPFKASDLRPLTRREKNDYADEDYVAGESGQQSSEVDNSSIAKGNIAPTSSAFEQKNTDYGYEFSDNIEPNESSSELNCDIATDKDKIETDINENSVGEVVDAEICADADIVVINSKIETKVSEEKSEGTVSPIDNGVQKYDNSATAAAIVGSNRNDSESYLDAMAKMNDELHSFLSRPDVTGEEIERKKRAEAFIFNKNSVFFDKKAAEKQIPKENTEARKKVSLFSSETAEKPAIGDMQDAAAPKKTYNESKESIYNLYSRKKVDSDRYSPVRMTTAAGADTELDCNHIGDLKNVLKNDGFTLKTYKKSDNYKAVTDVKVIYSTKLLRDTTVLSYLFLVVMLLVLYLARSTFLYSGTALLITGAIGLIVPIFGIIQYSKNPVKRTKSRYNFRLWLAYAVFAFILVFVINLLVCLLTPGIDVAVTDGAMYSPLLIAVTFPFATVCYDLLLKSTRYSVKI